MNIVFFMLNDMKEFSKRKYSKILFASDSFFFFNLIRKMNYEINYNNK